MTGPDEILFVAHTAGDDAEAVRAALGAPVNVTERRQVLRPPAAPTDQGHVPDAAVNACRWMLADCKTLPVEVALPDGGTARSVLLTDHPNQPRVRVVPMPGCVGIQLSRGLDTIGRPHWLAYPADVRDIDSSEFVTELSVAVRAAVDALNPQPKENE